VPTINDYRNKFPSLRELDDTALIARVAEVQGVPAEDVMAHMGYKPKARGMLSALNDTVIEGANAAAGFAKSVGDFVAPGNPVSEFIDENIIKAGEAKQSDVVKAEKARYRGEMDAAEGIGDEIGSTLGYVARNPLLSVAQAVGSFVGPGAAIKGAGMLSSAAGLGAKGAARAGLTAGALTGGAAAGGDAAGTAYELVKKAGGTDEESTEAARKASVLPAAIGAAGGVIGAERLFAGAGGFKGGMVSRALKTAGVEGAQEAVEEGVTQYEGQAAAAPFDTSIDPMKGVAGAATMGAALGGITGAGVSALHGEHAQPAKPGVVDVLAAPSVDDAINTAMQAVSVPKAPAVKPRQANADAAAELAMLDPADRTEALSLMQIAERQDISGNVRRFAQNRLDSLLAPIRTIPAGEATEMLPVADARELTDEERAEYANAAPFSYRRAMERGLPQPEVTELVPAGDATELEPIPVGDASEPIPAPEAYETLPTGEADELIPTADATEFEAVPTGEASELDVETIQAGDLLTRDEQPYGSKIAASVRAKKEGGAVVPVRGGWVVRVLQDGLDTQSPALQGLPDSGATDSTQKGALPKREASANQRLGNVNIPSQRPMLGGVLRSIQNDKVLRRVVELVPIDVMHMLIGRKVSPDALLSDKTMLRDALAAAVDNPVSVGVQVAADRVMRAVAGVAAELGAPGPNAVARAGELPPAMDAGKRPMGTEKGPLALSGAEGASSLAGADVGFGAIKGDAASRTLESKQVNSPTRIDERGPSSGATNDGPPTVRASSNSDKQKARDVNQPDLAGTAGKPAADGAGRTPDAVGSKLAVGRVADDTRAQQPGTAAAVAPGGAGDAPAGSGGGAGTALTTGDRITLKGESYTVVSATPSAVKLDDGAGNTRMVARNSKTFAAITKDDAQQAPAPRTQEAALTAATATPASAAPAGPANLEANGVGATPNAAAPASTQAPAPVAGEPVAAAPASEVSASDPMKRLGMVMRRAGWEIDYIDLDLTGDQPKADIRVNRGDGRFVIAKVDGQGRAMFETFQRDRNLRMDPKNPQSRMAPHLDDTFLGRQKFDGARSMLRGMVTYLADNATNPVALADMKAAWAGVMAGPVNSDMPALPAPAAAPAEAAPTAALTPKAQAVKEKLAATPKRTEARGKAKHPKTVAGSSVLAMVSQSMGGLDPSWLSEFSSRQEINRIGKDGRRMIQWRNPLIPGVGRLFRKGGTQDLSALGQLMEEAGYLPPGSHEADYKQAGESAKQMIRDALQGDEPLTWQGKIAKAQEEAKDEALSEPDWLSEFDDRELDDAGYTGAVPEVQQATAALLAEAEALGLDTESMVERAAMQAGDQPGNAYDEIIQRIAGEAIASTRRQAGGTDAEAAGRGNADRGTAAGEAGQEPAAQEGLKRPPVAEGDRIRFTSKDGATIDGMAVQVLDTSGGNYRIKIRTDEPAPQGGGNISRTVYSQDGTFAPLDEPLLTAQTADDLKAKTEREAAGAAAERAKKAAEQERLRREAEQRDNRARADQTVDDFQLGQSADQQLNGMGDMFADAPAAPAQQAAAILDAAAEPPKGKERLDVLKDVKAGAITPDEVAAAYPAAEQAAPAAPTNTEDAGAELTYNKRNRIKSGIKWTDIASKNDALKVKEAVKQNVYPRPDYQALVDGGMQPLVAHLVKQAYDAIAAKPNTRGAPTDADLQTYIAGVNRVMAGVLAWANDPVSLSKWATREARSAGAMLGKSVNLSELAPGGGGKSMMETVYPEGWKGNQAEVIVLGGNKLLGALQPSYDEAKRAGKAVDAGWPASQEAWEKRGIKIVHAEKIDVTYYEGKRSRTEQPYVSISYRVGQTRLMDQLIDGAESQNDPKVQAAVAAELEANQGMFIVMDKARRIVGKQETEEAAKDVARELTKREGKNAGPDDSGIDVAMARREGPPRRLDGENVSSNQLKDAFGFKGVNFGNWMKGDTPALRAERQAHLNHAYDSFSDLADLFGVPAKAMSLNGMLGLAIGAQGNGKYAAHFVPGVNEINLTRTSGAGSLAHEWGHALDHYFAEQAGFAKRDEPFLTEHTNSVVRKVVVENGRERMVVDTSAQRIRPEIVERFKAIVQAMNKKPETVEQFNARQERSKEIAKSNVSSWLKSIRRDYVAKGVDDAALDAIAARILSLDLGDGKIMVSPTLAVHPVVDELRALYRKKAGRVPPIDQIKGLQSNLDYYAYAMSEKPGAVDHVPQQVSTDYANAAASLDKEKGGKRYWSTNLEKFARAFDAFVSDELEAKAAKNTYLSHAGRTGETVPMGDERKTINAAIKALVGEIQTRADDAGNVALFSRAPGRSVELEAADAVGREFWRKIDNGESFTDQEVLDALSINRRGSRRLARGMRSVADQAGTGTAAVSWEGDLASFGAYTSSASWDGDNFNVFFIPDSIAGGADLNDDAQARDKALVHVSFKSAPGGSYELSLNDPQPGSTALAAVEAAGISAQVGTDSKRYTQIDLRYGDVTSRMVLQEALRRLALNIGRTPDVMYAGRDTGARTGKNTGPVEYSADTLRDKFSRAQPGRNGVPMGDAKAVIAAIREALPTAPPIQIHDSVRKAPENLRRLIRQAGAENDVEAVYHEGEIHVFPSNIASIERMQFVVAHHEVRHHGLRSMLGPAMGPAMLRMYASNPNLKAAADQKMADGLADTRVLAVEEALADMPVEELQKLTGWQRIVSAARQWLRQAAANLRRAGLTTLADAIEPKNWTDADIASLVQRAEEVSRGRNAPFRTGGTVFNRQDNPDWYSALADQVGKASMNAGPATAWKSLLKNWTTTGKVKADEVEWSGLNEWLDMSPGKITKAQVADYLRANGVQVQETVLGAGRLPPLPEGWRVEKVEDYTGFGDDGYQVLDENDEVMGEGATEQEAMYAAADPDEMAGVVNTKYGQYTLPGGTNYREVLLTLPVKSAPERVEIGRGPYEARQSYGKWFVVDRRGEWGTTDYPTKEAAEAAFPAREFKDTMRPTGPIYTSGHWDQPNVVAHIRVNDRVDAEGNRVLFVEEVQSDWGQAAKKKGVQRGEQMDGGQVVYDPDERDRVPNAPFIGKTDAWVGLALKRVIKMAVDGGYDKVAFVTGEQSAERYSLSKHIQTLKVKPLRGGSMYAIGSVLQDGQSRAITTGDGVPAENLPDLVGKEMAERIVTDKLPAGEWREYTGLDLKVGGEGMRAFYDKIVPAVTKDVLRKLGGGALETVGITAEKEVSTRMDDGAGGMVMRRQKTGSVLEQPGFSITQQMRDKALGGMPLFSRADQAQTPARPEAARAVGTGKRSPLTGKPLIDVLDADGNRIETSHIAKTTAEALENYRQRPARQAAARAAAPAPTYAMPEKAAKAEGSNWRRVRGQEFTSLDEDDAYLYHVTSAPAASGVREQGLVPNAGGMFGGFYANYSAGKVFLTERSGVSYWQEKVGQQLEAAMDNPPAVTVLRIPKDKIKATLQPDTLGSGDAGAPAFYSNQAVFSRATGTAKTTAQDLVNATGGVFDFNRMGETKQDRIRTIMDASRPGWLGLLTRDQIADIYGKEISPVKEYDDLTRQMENQRSKIAQDADDLYGEWAKLPAETNDKLARLMLDATIYSVHPDGAFNKLGKPNDAELKAQYALMGKEGQAIYGKVRDFHKGTLTQLRDALEERIKRQVENGQAKAAALTKIRTAFDAYLKEGPYFPLSRFGDFLVVGTRAADGERVVASYATAGEQAAAARTLEADGFTVKMKTAKTYSRETDGSAGKFIGDVLTTLSNLDMMDATVGGNVADLKTKLMDDVNQLFIKALPDLSYRKHFMHRKGTPGFSSDMMRGFASSAFHAASHIARLNHGDRMTFALQDAFTAIEQVPEGDFNVQSQVLNELTKRHDAALNPNTHPVAAMLNQVGFVMYLGLSPAAGIINMLQTVMVTMPHLGARYGFGKANGSLAKALTDITTGAKANAKNGWNAAQSTKLSAAERTMMSELQDEGVIDLTQAHDLSAATGLDTGNVARSKAAFAMARAMKIVGWTFHIPEVMNRQVTALSAYRLEMEKSGNEDAARDAAREAIKRTHFDYSSSNRARFMQGNVARVMLQFKQYGQNMTYLLGRAAHQALKGESPEVRSIARRQLIATFAVTWGMAGALGLPGLGTVAGLIGMLVGAMDDDDEPYDWKVEFRNLMADTFGKEAGEVISHGIPRALMPWDISNRVSLGDLWFRDGGREGQSPREAFATDAANILGPTAGTVLGLYTGADHMARGNWSKAVESVVPKFLRDPLKAIREGSEGVTSYNGEPLMDVSGAEVAGRLLGFAPARASEMYEGKAAVMNAKTAIEEKRQSLISRMAKARIDKDTDTAAELQPEIAAFNQRNPDFKITGATLAKAIMTRMKNRQNTEAGILLPRTKQGLRELGRFAEVD
jgi:hypothetical protein